MPDHADYPHTEKRYAEAPKPRYRNGRHNRCRIAGVLNSRETLAALVCDLNARGYKRNDISMLMSEPTYRQYFEMLEADRIKGPLGAVLSALAPAGYAALSGVRLLGAGVPDEMTGVFGDENRFLEETLSDRGNILLAVHIPDEEMREVRALFERHHVNCYSGDCIQTV